MRCWYIIPAALLVCACKGHAPNTVRKDLPFAGDAYGPSGAPADNGFAHAIEGTLLHVVSAQGKTLVVDTWREDGRHEGQQVILEAPDALWDVSDDRIAGELGEWALDWETHEAMVECIAAGPKKRTESLRLHQHNLLALPDGGWALAFTARLVLQCQTPEKVRRYTAHLDHVIVLDGQLAPAADPVLYLYGPECTAQAMVMLAGEPALAWVTTDDAGFVSSEKRCPLPTREGELDVPPRFVATDTGVAVVTRIGGAIRVRLIEERTTEPEVDLTIDPGLPPLSHAAAWTGDRLGVFIAVDKTEGTGTILQHIMVEVFPDGHTGPATKVYTQYSMAEDPQYTRQLTAICTDGTYALAWMADDGFSQDVHVQELPVGGPTQAGDVAQTWEMDLGDGYRALQELSLFATPPQYVLVLVTALAHEIRLTALPTDR